MIKNLECSRGILSDQSTIKINNILINSSEYINLSKVVIPQQNVSLHLWQSHIRKIEIHDSVII